MKSMEQKGDSKKLKCIVRFDDIMNELLQSVYRKIAYVSKSHSLEPIICIQGGGAKGGWQGGVLEELLSSNQISPIGAFGSSAGAINSFLISAKVSNRSILPFSDFWLNLNDRLRIKLVIILLILLTPIFLFLFLIKIPFSIFCLRFPGIIPFTVFRIIIKRLFNRPFSANIFTYLYSTDLSKKRPKYDSQNLGTFQFKPNESGGLFLFSSHDHLIPWDKALAASCCLPLVNSSIICWHPYADGGMHSNLPVDALLTQGALGGNAAIVVLSTPINKMEFNKNDINYRTIQLLRKIKAQQLASNRSFIRQGRHGVFPPLLFSPVIIIEPGNVLDSGIIKGFCRQDVLSSDFKEGQMVGSMLRQAIESFIAGNQQSIVPHLLISKQLPRLPKRRPQQEWWGLFSNWSWYFQNT